MGYNITKCIVKKMDELRFPISALKEHNRTDWHPDIDGTTIELSESSLTGTTKDGWFYVDKFNVSGECSGNFMYYSLENALKKSKGFLEVVFIWEGGDTVEKLIVDNGVYSTKEVDSYE